MKKKKRSALEQTTRDIGMFSVGAVTLGAGSAATGAIGHGASAGMPAIASMMPAIGSVMMMKGTVGMIGEAMPKRKRRRGRK